MAAKRRRSADTADGLLQLVEQERAARGVTKAELARQSHVRAETVRHLLTRKGVNPTLSNVLDMLRPLGLGLGLVELTASTRRKASRVPAKADPEMLRARLAHYGAALYGASKVDLGHVPPPEVVLAEALDLSREDASVARALPVAFWRCRGRLDMRRMRREARLRGQSRALGFFLHLTGMLANDPELSRKARDLRARLPAKPTPFFRNASGSFYERELSALRTPEVARRWKFQMNMSMDSFKSTFAKAVG